MKNDYSWNLDSDCLFHHGITGQKWGITNGPPYPLSPSISTGSSLKKSASGTRPGTSVTPGSDRSNRTKNVVLAALLPASVAGFVGIAATTGFLVMPLAASAFKGGKAIANLVSGDKKEKDAKKKADQYEKERQSNPVDKKTGFHLKTTKLDEYEDMKRVNPEFANWDTNTKNNCVMCSLTYDMRRRGYDVTAETSLKGVNSMAVTEEVYKNSKNKIKTFHEIKSINDLVVSKSYSDTLKSEAYNELKKQPDGSRGLFSVGWNNSSSGHCMNYEVKNGEVYIIDSQANKKYPYDKFVDDVNTIDICRIDNLKVDYSKMKEYMR